MREGIAAGRQGDLHLFAGDERPRRRRAEEVVLLVDRPGLQHGEEIVGGELLTCVDEIELARAGAIGLLGQTGGLLSLTYVDGHGHDLATVVLFQPGNDDRGVEPARVGEADLLDRFPGVALHVDVYAGAGVVAHAAFSLDEMLASTLSSAATNSDRAFFGTMYGGRRRMTLSLAVPQTKPLAMSSATTGLAGRCGPHPPPIP